jgi:acyl-coenzyme A thioesterase PaaI-like protein
MAADESGLVHGGFVFGLADYAAMLAVNHPNVVLAGAAVRFVKPVKVDEEIEAEARVVESDGKKRKVAVDVRRGEESVCSGELSCYVPERHVLSPTV